MKKPKFIKNNAALSNVADRLVALPRDFGSTFFPGLISKIIYYKQIGKQLNLKHPKLFNEKLMWLKLNYYNHNPLVTECADKYLVRNYVKRCGLENILNILIGAWDSVDDIPWDSFPARYAIKCNHGCGYNLICDDKEKFNINTAKTKLNKWMAEDFWKQAAELNYRDIPHKIISEKYIGAEDKTLPTDYKVYCFGGVPKFLGVYYDRVKETHILKRGYFDFEWEPVDFMKDEYTADCANCPKPKNLEEIYRIASILSKPFPFVRVDLYEYENVVIFGELTFTPAFCTGTMFTDRGMKLLGDWITMPE